MWTGEVITFPAPEHAYFVLNVACAPQSHSMDFDDTWHPATHPSGAVLPALLAISDMLPRNSKPSGMDLLTAFNVGIEIQGRLLRFSNEAQNIPKRSVPCSGLVGQSTNESVNYKTKFWPLLKPRENDSPTSDLSLFLQTG